MRLPDSGEFGIEICPIIGNYNKQRFRQWSPEDAANWYLVTEQNTKKPYAMYPVLGRAHINYLGSNQLIFGSEPRGMFKTIKYAYVIVGNTIYRVDQNYQQVAITASQPLLTVSGEMYFAYLVVNAIVFACFVDTEKIYIYREDTGAWGAVTDPNAPGNGTNGKPGYIAQFGNRITVSVRDSSQFILSRINLLQPNGTFDLDKCFTNDTTPQVFAREEGIIRQMGTLNNTLYIFTDYETGVWSNFPAVFSGTGVSFPWKKSSTYNWNFGIANSTSLDINFGVMVFLARNYEGLLQFMMSTGGQPEPINNKAISTLLQQYTNLYGRNNPFLSRRSNGFLYQYEDVIFYRMSGGEFSDTQILDQEQSANSIEYNFETKEWHRCIEVNGNRNRVQLHLYFNDEHWVTLENDNTVYKMSGQYYYNEARNPAQDDPQAEDAYLAYPFRYERVTPIIFDDTYCEFETEFVQIDFVFGDSNLNYSTAQFDNTKFIVTEGSTPSLPIYIVAEQADSDNNPVFMITNDGNYPSLSDKIYNQVFNPNIMLYWSDDGGITYNSADNLEFAQMGVYQWRMRWYQLGTSRNRVYKLICVSPVPVVVLGGIMNIRRVSGGAY